MTCVNQVLNWDRLWVDGQLIPTTAGSIEVTPDGYMYEQVEGDPRDGYYGRQKSGEIKATLLVNRGLSLDAVRAWECVEVQVESSSTGHRAIAARALHRTQNATIKAQGGLMEVMFSADTITTIDP